MEISLKRLKMGFNGEEYFEILGFSNWEEGHWRARLLGLLGLLGLPGVLWVEVAG